MSVFYLTLRRNLAEIPGSINIQGLQKIKNWPFFLLSLLFLIPKPLNGSPICVCPCTLRTICLAYWLQLHFQLCLAAVSIT